MFILSGRGSVPVRATVSVSVSAVSPRVGTGLLIGCGATSSSSVGTLGGADGGVADRVVGHFSL